MSAITGVGSAISPYPITNQGGFDQIVEDFNSIGAALQSGNVSSAQTALVAFQQDLHTNPLTSASQSFGGNSVANADYQSLVGALQIGNLSNAQRAFASLQADLQFAQSPSNPGNQNHSYRGSHGVSSSMLVNSLIARTSSPADGGGYNVSSGLNATA
jgi:hypothetical protein